MVILSVCRQLCNIRLGNKSLTLLSCNFLLIRRINEQMHNFVKKCGSRWRLWVQLEFIVQNSHFQISLLQVYVLLLHSYKINHIIFIFGRIFGIINNHIRYWAAPPPRAKIPDAVLYERKWYNGTALLVCVCVLDVVLYRHVFQ